MKCPPCCDRRQSLSHTATHHFVIKRQCSVDPFCTGMGVEQRNLFLFGALAEEEFMGRSAGDACVTCALRSQSAPA